MSRDLCFWTSNDTVIADCTVKCFKICYHSRTDDRVISAMASSFLYDPHSSRPTEFCVMGGAEIFYIPLGLVVLSSSDH